MVQLPRAGDFLDADRIVRSLGIKPGQHAADFGCGSGFFTIALAKAVGLSGRVVAIDVMNEPLEAVRTRTESMGLKNIDVVRADLEILGGTKLSDGSQDVVMLKNVLFQSHKQDSILVEASRVLKSGGRLAIIDWAKGKGGLGPPDELRIDEAQVHQLCGSVGLSVGQSLSTDQYHFGFIANK